jgi:hypothetical protein
MTENDIIQNGADAETLLADAAFNRLFELTQTHLANQILATAATDLQTREQLYFTYQGLRTFVGTLGQMVSAKDNALAMRAADAESEADAQD